MQHGYAGAVVIAKWKVARYGLALVHASDSRRA